MATRRQKAKTRATSPKRDKLVRKRKPKADNPKFAVTRLKAELRESLEQQMATTEVLEVINASQGDLAPVFDVMLEKAMRFCEAAFGVFASYDGELVRPLAYRGLDRQTQEVLSQPFAPSTGTLMTEALERGAAVTVPDLRDTASYRSGVPSARILADGGGARTVVWVPLRKDDRSRGVLVLYRREVRAFTDKQISLLQNFAAQAVIAMENARLLGELRGRTDDLTESLEYQTATSSVLKVISRSTFDMEPVLNTLAETALQLCAADQTFILREEGQVYRVLAGVGSSPDNIATVRQYRAYLDTHPIEPGRGTVAGRAVLECRPVHIHDIATDPEYKLPQAMTLGNVHTTLGVPLLRDGEPVGVIVLSRQRVEPFTGRQIELVRTFADQAVIAMENARLLSELHERTDDLTQSLEYQTATSEVLEVIGRSTSDIQPVLDTMLSAALRLCRTESGGIAIQQGEGFRYVATLGWDPEADKAFRSLDITPGRGTVAARVLAEGRIVQVEDVASDPEFALPDMAERAQWHTALGVPLMRDDRPIGVIAITRDRIEPFTGRQIALAKTFADQAVIAMENARLLGELRESLEQQTAAADVLRVINLSPGNLTPVFSAILEKAMHLCEAAFGTLWMRDGDVLTQGGIVSPAYADFLAKTPVAFGRNWGAPGTVPGRIMAGELEVQVEDLAAETPYLEGDAHRRALVDLGGARSAFAVPLLKDAAPIGYILIYRQEVRRFDDRQAALLKNFAAQAVIAMENARLLSELRQRTDDLIESLEYQTAISELLEVISRSTMDVQPVFETILSAAKKLCDVENGGIAVRSGDVFRYAIVRQSGVAEMNEILLRRTFVIDRTTLIGRTAVEARVVHIEDVKRDAEYTMAETAVIGGVGTMLGVPLIQNQQVMGVIVLTRLKVEPFTERQIALVRTFADQAVIAMENARLLGELTRREEELRVTFDNMGDGVAMFDAEPRLVAWNRNFEDIIGLPDALLAERPSYTDYLRLLAERGEFGTENVEAELASRLENTDRELRLERTRADGTVIEVRRNAVPGGGFVLIYSDVTEQRRAEAEIRAARDDAEAALERQTATAGILGVIASSPSNVQPAFDAIAQSANRLLGGRSTAVWRFEGDKAILEAFTQTNPEADEALKALSPLSIAENHNFAPVIRGQIVQIADTETAPAQTRDLARLRGFRAQLLVPLLAQSKAIGFISVTRKEASPFEPDDVQLLQTFADQAVIAIQNARLFTDLSESLEQQTATAEILTVISQSPTDVGPVLSAVAKAAMKFCAANDALISLRDGDEWVIAAHEGPIETMIGERRMLTRHTAPGRAMTDGKVVQIMDLQSVEADEFPEGREIGARLGFRSALAAPLLRDDVSIGAISLRRREAGEFEPRQVELLKTFAAQAVIAIENVRLFTELRDSLERLKAAQANLIQAEKMASLGQLTAGIAHEIKNPLNFVNNFAGLSVELLDELKQAATPVLAGMDEDARAEFGETVDLITANLEKIAEHGRRADGIVKSMLAHSRGGTGDWQGSNINALVEEALNLAYHGARAQDKDFNVTLERDFAPDAQPIEVVPQDVTRVFLNLFGNGFYAAKKRQLTDAGDDYRPTLSVSTRDLSEAVEIKVRDNGTGIPPQVREKLFQPFFTTKPTGEGTGLGLSISYDIVTQQHGGSIDVESEPGSFTEFTVRLPRRRRAA